MSFNCIEFPSLVSDVYERLFELESDSSADTESGPSGSLGSSYPYCSVLTDWHLSFSVTHCDIRGSRKKIKKKSLKIDCVTWEHK